MTREKAWHVDRETYVQQYVVGIVAGIMSIVLVLYWIVDTRQSGVLPSTGKGIVISAREVIQVRKDWPTVYVGFRETHSSMPNSSLAIWLTCCWSKSSNPSSLPLTTLSHNCLTLDRTKPMSMKKRTTLNVQSLRFSFKYV